MENHQKVRLLGIIAVLLSYIVSSGLSGTTELNLFGAQISRFALTLVVIVLLAAPETIEYLPFGPTRND